MDEPLNDTMVQLSWILHTRFMSKIYLFYSSQNGHADNVEDDDLQPDYEYLSHVQKVCTLIWMRAFYYVWHWKASNGCRFN